ncbi:MAG TPA: helicase C-terminal domain-containing protein, partial [Chitinophagales bacterium]|nr:helicase C-terminal domain-containing protein [Chitinophagales bacterium]
TNANIEHQYYLVQPKNKYAALKRILDYNPDIYGIIFCRTKAETQEIAEKLIKDGYNADSLHGDLSQMQRDKVMLAFRERTLQMLIATDVAARGIDIDNLTHIINLHLPDDMDFYTHRSGRTARAGKTGISLVLISEKDLYKIKHLERKLQMQFKKMTVPSGIEVCEKQLLNMIHRVHEVEVNEAEIAKYLPVIEKEFADMTKEDVLKKFASLEFNRFLEYYRFAEDLNIGERREVREYATKKGNNDLMFINLGKMDNLGAKELVEMVKQVGNVRPHDIGDIRLKGAYSFFELPANQSQRVVQAFNGFVYRGRRVRVEIQNERQEFPKKKAHKGGSREMKPYKGKRK